MPVRSKYTVDIPDNLTMSDMVLGRAEQYKDRIALVDPVSKRSISFAQYSSMVRSVAHSLYKLGVRPGDVVLTFCPNNVMYPVILVAVPYIGAVITTCNPRYTADELLYQLDDCHPKLLIVAADYLPTVRKATSIHQGIQELYVLADHEVPSVRSFQDLLDGDASFVSPLNQDANTHVALLLYSSGTTGRAKGVMLTHHNIVANVYQDSPEPISKYYGAHDVVLISLPLFHASAISALFEAWFVGATVVIMEKFDLEEYLRLIQLYKVTMVPMIPPVMVQLLTTPLLSQYDLSSVLALSCGAAPLGAAVGEQVLRRTGIPNLRQAWGMTELSPVATRSPKIGWKHGSCGVLIANTEAMVVAESGQEVGVGVHGEIWVRGPQVMAGYWNNPQATAATIDPQGWLHTGDIGYYDADEHFFVVDRLKELIKWKGNQVAPAELEALLLQHPDVTDAAVVGIPDPEAGELPRAFVVKMAGIDVTEEDIVKFVHDRVSPHKRLRGGVQFVSEIPKSPAGKILRRIIRDKMLSAKL